MLSTILALGNMRLVTALEATFFSIRGRIRHTLPAEGVQTIPKLSAIYRFRKRIHQVQEVLEVEVEALEDVCE